MMKLCQNSFLKNALIRKGKGKTKKNDQVPKKKHHRTYVLNF
jgi:hypothetical protein